MTAARDLLRAAVLGTNAYWPFSQVNRWPYEAALYAVIRQVRRSPNLRSVYLRVPPQQPWIPGLSDIDLTLVLACDSAPDREYELLRSFWSGYPRLRRLFPMLGEVEVLDETEVAGWLAWTIPEAAGPSWTLRYGQANPHVRPAPSPHWRRRALITALWVYVTHLPTCFARPDSPLRRHDVRRRVRKILRLLAPILTQTGHHAFAAPAQTDDAFALVAHALGGLERAATQLVPSLPGLAPAARSAAPTVVEQGGRRFLVVDDGLALERLAEALRAVWTGTPGPRERPIVLPRSLFAYYVRDYEPASYGELLGSRAAGGTPDRVSGIPSPGREQFAAHARDRLYHLPLFVRGPELFSSPFSMDSLRNQVNSALAAVIFLKGGAALPYPDKRHEDWRRELPHYVAPFAAIEALHRSRQDAPAHHAAFCFMRSILRDARELMVP